MQLCKRLVPWVPKVRVELYTLPSETKHIRARRQPVGHQDLVNDDTVNPIVGAGAHHVRRVARSRCHAPTMILRAGRFKLSARYPSAVHSAHVATVFTARMLAADDWNRAAQQACREPFE